MSRRVTHDGKETLEVRFPFDRALVDRIKSLPRRRWNAGDKFWAVPQSEVVSLVDLLRAEGFLFDRTTRQLYRDAGGQGVLEEAPDDGPLLPGLFDTPLPRPAAASAMTAAAATTTAAAPTDYTVSGLNEHVREVIASALPGTIWLIGEISGFNKSAHRRHVGFELTERTDSGDTVSRISATLFESTRREIDAALSAAGEPFRLEDEITVRLRVRVELYVPWGQYRAVVEELDLRYTLGEAARRREEILRRLGEQGLIGKNSALGLPRLPLRLGLITSIGSDAYNDVLRTLQEAGYAFDVTVHGARVQGRATEPSVLNALDWFRAREEQFDVLLICRGGGSRTDLVWFDSEPLGRAVAGFPLPVVVGIGHEQDQSVLDAVGRSCKTPTAAAALLVETARESQELCESRGRAILECAAQIVEEQRALGGERARRLALTARHRLAEARSALTHHRRQLAGASRSLLAGAGQQVASWSRLLPQLAWRAVEQRRLILDGARRAIGQGTKRELEIARHRLGRACDSLDPHCRRMLERETERLQGRAQRLRLADPRRVLDRGYSILRLAGGELLTRSALAPRGTMVRARLKDGELRLRSEGEGGD